MLGATDADVERKLADLETRLAKIVGPDAASGSMGAFRGMPAVGTPDKVAENLRGLEEAGMSYGIFYFPNIAHDREDLELFEQQVVPALR